MANALIIQLADAAYDAEDIVPLREQEFGKVAAILTGDTRDKRIWHDAVLHPDAGNQ
jgi:hypothetical protein